MFAVLLSFPIRPDPALTWGSFCSPRDQDFLELRGSVAVCRRNVWTAVKNRVYAAYGIAAANRGEYTIDHLVPLSLGGSNRPDNLWPQHKSISSVRLETDLHLRFSRGLITHQEALGELLAAKVGRR
jgi:hypothetical protein